MTPAEIEEQAEIRMLRERADEAAGQVADTLAVLAARIAQTGGPQAWARRWLAEVRVRALRAAREVPGQLAGVPGQLVPAPLDGQRPRPARIALAAAPVLVTLAGALAVGRYRQAIMKGLLVIRNGRWYPPSAPPRLLDGLNGQRAGRRARPRHSRR